MRRPSISFLSALSICLLVLNGVIASAHATDGKEQTNTPPPLTQKNAPASQLAFMELSLTTENQTEGEISVDEAFSLYFLPDATTGWDRYDASKLFPRSDQWAAIAFKGEKGGEDVLKAQESRPYRDSVQVVDVKIIQKNMPAATYTINVQTWYSVPKHWSLRLHSDALDTTFVIDDASDKITFDMGASSQSTNVSVPSASKNTSDTTHVAMAGKVGPPAATLPVEMASFSVNANQDEAVLRWETASETNNSGFAIQHRQESTKTTPSNWSQIGFVNGHGTTNQPRDYEFTSSSLEPGTHLFRLKQIDRDGTTHYSETVKLIRKPTGRVELTTAPNPFVDQVTVTLTPRSSQTVTIQLVDMLAAS